MALARCWTRSAGRSRRSEPAGPSHSTRRAPRMCGICGAAWTDPNSALSAESLQAMMDRLVRRGPDDAGAYRDDQAALGFRRLAIIDLAGGHQPLSNEDGTVWTVFNGEIYNYPALRRRLE